MADEAYEGTTVGEISSRIFRGRGVRQGVDAKSIDAAPYFAPSQLAGATGAEAELRVAADLISRGFLVFRNLSANGPVDLVALSPKGTTHLIEVTTGRRPHPCSKGTFPPHKERHLWEIIAVCYGDGIVYFDRQGRALEVSPWLGVRPVP